MKVNLLILSSLLYSSTLLATDLYPFPTQQDKDRFQALTQEIRCVVCQNQAISDSYAPLAKDLRKKIYERVLAKASDQEIKAYLTKRYGDFILLKPKFNPGTFLLWLFPLLAPFVCFYLIFKPRSP